MVPDFCQAEFAVSTNDVNFDAKLTVNKADQILTLAKWEDSAALAGGDGSASATYTVTSTYTVKSPYKDSGLPSKSPTFKYVVKNPCLIAKSPTVVGAELTATPQSPASFTDKFSGIA